jgi:hypothetical protein
MMNHIKTTRKQIIYLNIRRILIMVEYRNIDELFSDDLKEFIEEQEMYYSYLLRVTKHSVKRKAIQKNLNEYRGLINLYST